jgi:fructosamine-3-kinase
MIPENNMLREIASLLELSDVRYEKVYGGDINSCWSLRSANAKFFVKLNDADSYPGMFEKEANGLRALKSGSEFVIPSVIRQGVADGQQFLVLEWLAAAGEDDQYSAGKMLAGLHMNHSETFGWGEDNYIGSLIQPNIHHSDWPGFFRDCRLMPMIERLSDQQKITIKDIKAAERFSLQLAGIFPEEPACLLHGDLWSGNYMNTENGPAIFDPAVYYGHRETDIGMTRLFGGFNEDFYRGYEEVYPLEKNWKERLPYSQLYPLLVHAVLFGGSYISKAMSIVDRFGI